MGHFRTPSMGEQSQRNGVQELRICKKYPSSRGVYGRRVFLLKPRELSKFAVRFYPACTIQLD
jgi:hypothetical protein